MSIDLFPPRSPRRSTRRPLRLAALPLATGLLFAGATAATAHVTVTPSATMAGSSAVLTFSVGHGCDGSPTTRIAIKMPEQVLSVTPTRNPSWTVEKRMTQLAEPVEDAHGNELTERVDRIVYSAREPLADGFRDTFELQLTLPDAPGETLSFPTIQTCEQGQTAWIEIPSDGQDPESLEAPSPSFVLDDDEADSSESDGPEPEEAEPGEADETSVQSAAATSDAAADDGTSGLAVAGLVAGLLGLAAGAAALVQVRRRP